MADGITTRRLIFQGLTFYWRTNLAVVAGVATAVAVLAGALLVGDSVRGSLRDLVLERIGNTDHIVVSTDFFREALASDLSDHPDFSASFDSVAPIIVAEGVVTTPTGEGRVDRVRVYGIDDRFWQFHGVEEFSGPEGRQALVSPALAEGLGVGSGATILVRVERPSEIPLESLHGNKDDLGRTIRATLGSVVPPETLGEFSLEAGQGEVHAVFLPLELVTEDLEIEERVNALLVSTTLEDADAATAELERIVRSEARLEDLGLGLRFLEQPQTLTIEGAGGLIDDQKVDVALEAGAALGLETRPMFTYLVNRLGNASTGIPYSLVTATDLTGLIGEELPSVSGLPPITLTDWAAEDLGVSNGDRLSMEYYVWVEPGQLVTRETDFEVVNVVSIDVGDRDMAPTYPGITDSGTLADWNPPFPIDLARIRPVDEEFWDSYRTTPKAFIPLEVGRELWKSRYGSISSIRFAPVSAPGNIGEADILVTDYAENLGGLLDPLASGLAVRSVRSEGLEASRGATNFGEYFVYFSFFLVVSALMLAALFFKLSVEQRIREVGLLRSVGFTPRMVRRLFLVEGLILSSLGSVIGLWGGVGYASLLVTALGTWWVDAVGTTAVTLHVSSLSLVAGVVGGIAAAMACIWATLGSLSSVSERRLLAGQLAQETRGGSGRNRNPGIRLWAISLGSLGIVLIVGAGMGFVDQAAGFFGAGMAFLAASLCFLAVRFGQPGEKVLEGQGWWPVSRLGLRNATYRPARSVTAIGMIAAATFILISVDAFRRDTISNTGTESGLGGYPLLVESLLPVLEDPMSRAGQESLGLGTFSSVAVQPFRLRPGDDASCLNLYAPTNPRVAAPSDAFIEQGRFAFQDSLASNEAERANPWLLLQRDESDGAIPVIADANSMTYVLHRKLGEEIVINEGDRAIRLRLVAALDDSIFQGELLMSEAHFLEQFPRHEGYRLLLIETDAESVAEAKASIENALADYGATVTPTAERLAQFHRVENTYLSTFQMLGGLGLLLGTIGLGTVLLRNVLERRRELALMRALGYLKRDFLAMSMAENLMLLAVGLVTGAACAFLATLPVILDRGGQLPGMLVFGLLGSVLAVGLIASLWATIVVLRSPLLPALREE